MTWMRCTVLLACALPALAQAQAAVGAGAVSEYWVRGVPLGKGVAPQLSVNWDARGGWFAGALLTRAQFHRSGPGAAGVVYAGLARRVDQTLSVEGGASAVRFHGASRYDYREVFAGLTAGRTGARLYYSPHYYGVGGRSVYVELNGSIGLSDEVELTLHAGRLHADEGRAQLYYTPPGQRRTDVRIGVAGTWNGWTVHLSALAAKGDRAAYAARGSKSGVVAGVMKSF